MQAGANVRADALLRGIRLEWVTVVWMAVEAAIAIGAGVAARSVLLTAFGADSVIELLSGVTLILSLHVAQGRRSQEQSERAEAWATRISAVLLVLLCVYVGATSAAGLLLGLRPDGSWVGVAIAALAIVVMPWLAARKSLVNKTLESPALKADIAESVSCAYLAAVTLAGLGISELTGWWWIQYVAALGLLVWLVPEAKEAIESATSAESG